MFLSEACLEFHDECSEGKDTIFDSYNEMNAAFQVCSL